MPRNGSGVYSLPSGYLAVDGQLATAAQHNDPLQDVESDANVARPVVAGGTGATVAADARDNLGLTIGTDVQAYDAGLASIAGLTTAADKMSYTTAADTYAVSDLTAAGRSIVGLALGTTRQIIRVNAGATAAEYGDNIGFETELATTSDPTINFASIPASVRRITVMLDTVSTNGTDNVLIQIGDTGGLEITGYEATAGTLASASQSVAASSDGFIVTSGSTAASELSGMVTLMRMSGNKWVASGSTGDDAGNTHTNAGVKTLSAELDRLTLTTTGGTDTFDAGAMNIAWEF